MARRSWHDRDGSNNNIMAGSKLTPVQRAFPNPFPRAGDSDSSSIGLWKHPGRGRRGLCGCRLVEGEWLDEGAWCGGGAGCGEAVDVKASRYILKGALETHVGIEFVDVVLKSLDPALLLGKTLTTFFLAIADKFRNIVGQPLVLHVIDIRESGADGGDDGGGEGSRM